MSSQNMECRIAQAQMGRYLGGTGLSDEAIAQLEQHVRSCNECASAIRERRQSLESLLALPVEEFPALQITHPHTKKSSNPGAIALIRTKLASRRAVVSAPTEKDASRKTLVYSGLLSVVLVAMSLIAKDPTRVFGNRATQPLAAKPKTTESPLLSTKSSSAIEIAPTSFDFVPEYARDAVREYDEVAPEADLDVALADYAERTGAAVVPMPKSEPLTTPKHTPRVRKARRSTPMVRAYLPEANN